MSIKKFTQFKHSGVIALVLGAILIALISFSIGVRVGTHKAKFSFRWGENYEKNFLGGPMMPPPPGKEFFKEFEGKGFRNGHGIAGTIISINGNNLVIKDNDDKENTVTVTDKTVIKKFREDIKLEDLKQDDQVAVIGKPSEEGVINADMIRVFDNLFNMQKNSNSQIN